MVLVVGSTIIFLFVLALVAISIVGSDRLRERLAHPKAIIVGGVVFPIVTLTALLAYGLTLIPMKAEAESPLQIAVEGERWWWRVTYPMPDGTKVETANELRLPAGRPVRIQLTTADVIHSFWIPELAGKLDMIPGRTNVRQFNPNKPGSYRGQCAEYCGGAHALMGLRAVVLEPAAFDAWFAKERSPAQEPEGPEARRGRELFMTRGCPACHTITGISAVGQIGPNLTHIGSRRAIAAERLPMSKENLKRWIQHNDRLKPNNLMPSYAEVPDEEIEAIATYLAGLQ
jgi:cytochrome c oxidase subunit 2